MQFIRYRLLAFLFLALALSSCADDDFFQKDALATAEELEKLGPAGGDSVWVIPGRHYDRSGFHRFFWGDHNREIWVTPVKLPVFHLDSLHGGLQVVKKGGGFQSTSFELMDSTGRVYALRSIDKDPIHVVSKFWQPTFVSNVLRDQTSAANPYGALVVPVLAEAIGVPHSSPKLYYISSSDTTFGEYNKLVQGKVFLLEQKYESTADLTSYFKGAVDFEESDDALRSRFENNHHHFDQKAFARARLFDLLLGDWDRHKGQWDWAVKPQGQDTIFIPIPKDRDQVFFKMQDGLIPRIATSKIMARKFQSFEDDFDDVKGYMINARFIDERLLNELSKQDWIKIANRMQSDLTDNVIEKAVRQLLPPVYTLKGEEIIRNLKSRRNLLPEVAEKMYEKFAKEVIIPGSDAEEHFLVKRLDDNRTEVIVTRPATINASAKKIYHRIFNRKDTNKIILYGLGENDKFILTGNVQEGILVKIYGGLGSDEITDNSSVQGWKKYTEVYDTERGNEIVFGTEAKDKTTRDVRVHAFDREGN
ncbi:hypothetical protein [Pontibacter cellulosilyticus]|uniref:Uncharacterized protein n=1 Tax=Pontibacter cellulosilyticus TaxID=1720253 RepID=A0A923N383_9BACT|nr:hypothetical protein [Pontibacter cellulosilyticus]MBC5991339.1 hypothetical protein [Pontibacter cellulosilyticus]